MLETCSINLTIMKCLKNCYPYSYFVSLSLDKWTSCKSLWTSAKSCKCRLNVIPTKITIADHYYYFVFIIFIIIIILTFWFKKTTSISNAATILPQDGILV